MKKLLTLFALGAITLVTTACSPVQKPKPPKFITPPVSNFETCMASGGAILESFPRQCSFEGQNYTEIVTEANEADKETCEEQGGKYEQGGILGAFYCNQPSENAGAACTGQIGECDGLCLDSGDGTGVCSEYQTNFGCIPIIEDGQAVTICID